MTAGIYWLIALGVYFVWAFGVAVWIGRRIASGKGSSSPFWDLERNYREYKGSSYYSTLVTVPRGDGWPMVWALLGGLPFAAGWFCLVPAGFLALVFWVVVLTSKRGYVRRARKAREQVQVLRDRAVVWDGIAEDPEQIPATRDAARATATALREQARGVRVPSLAGEKR